MIDTRSNQWQATSSALTPPTPYGAGSEWNIILEGDWTAANKRHCTALFYWLKVA